MNVFRYECKVIGPNLYLLSGLLVSVFSIVCALGGELVNWSYLGLEVIFPFYCAIAAGEWGRTRSDPMFEIIAAQSNSLFIWALRRWLFVFLAIFMFAVACMIAVTGIKKESTIPELIFIYLSPSLFLSTLSAFVSLLSRHEHTGTMASGFVWMLMLMIKSVSRVSFVPFVYLFAGYAEFPASLLQLNKASLLALSLLLWSGIFLLCRRIQRNAF